ncbi:hypothetical protein [Flavobacterium sp.]|uniref:hypothetical protein n=1 Tax=Flavobacterium sp. TaxID=239 RepID=UPI003752AF9B
MGATELKEYIISKIRLTSDEEFLSRIKEIIDIDDSKIYSLSDEQIKLLEESEIQYENKNFIDEFQMDNLVDKWLKEK